MYVNPAMLIDQTIDNLQRIAALLRDDLDELTGSASPSDIFRFRAGVKSIDALVPQLIGVKDMLRSACAVSELQGLPPRRVCANCED